MKKIVVLCLGLFAFSTINADDYREGIDAFKKGDYQVAYTALNNACEAGNQVACKGVGFMYENGKGINIDTSQAIKYYKKACNEIAFQGCINLGDVYGFGAEGIAIDQPLAYYYYNKSCNNGDSDGCKQLNDFKPIYSSQLIQKGNILEAYQTGLIDKDTARTEMLKRGQIIEAYETKLIDKDTADLYLQKQSMDNATRAAQQQQLRIQQEQLAIQSQQLEEQQKQGSRDAWNSISQSLNSIGNSFNQSANQINQQDQNRRTNYQLQQINNGINNLNGNSKLQPIIPNF